MRISHTICFTCRFNMPSSRYNSPTALNSLPFLRELRSFIIIMIQSCSPFAVYHYDCSSFHNLFYIATSYVFPEIFKLLIRATGPSSIHSILRSFSSLLSASITTELFVALIYSHISLKFNSVFPVVTNNELILLAAL